jgi:hypothetical protein
MIIYQITEVFRFEDTKGAINYKTNVISLSSSLLIDHILCNESDKITKSRVTEVSISDIS